MLSRQISRLSSMLLRNATNCIMNQSTRSKWSIPPWESFNRTKSKSHKEGREIKKFFLKMERKMKFLEQEIAKMKPSMSGLIQRPLMPMTYDTEVSETGEKMLKIQLDMPEFLPEEIKVTVQDRIVTIKAKRMERNGDEKSYQEFIREFTLPDGVIDENVKYDVDKDSRLIVKALLPKGATIEK